MWSPPCRVRPISLNDMKKLLFSIFLVLAATGWGKTYSLNENPSGEGLQDFSVFASDIAGMGKGKDVPGDCLVLYGKTKIINDCNDVLDLNGRYVVVSNFEFNGTITITDSYPTNGGFYLAGKLPTKGKIVFQGGKVNYKQTTSNCVTKASDVSYVYLANKTTVNDITFDREAVKSPLDTNGYLIEATNGYPAVVLDYNWSLTNFNIKMTTQGKINEAATNLYTRAHNGLTYYENYVLGLDPAVAPSPAKIVRSSRADRFSFSVNGGPDLSAYNTDSAVRPLYQLQVGDGSGAFTDFGRAAADLSEVAAELPPSTSPARHYRAKIVYKRVR